MFIFLKMTCLLDIMNSKNPHMDTGTRRDFCVIDGKTKKKTKKRRKKKKKAFINPTSGKCE